MNAWKMRGKEADPEATVARVKEILDGLGLQFKLTELERSLHDCYACRLVITNMAGEIFGTNGKGMTEALSHASACGEMMERMENRIFAAMPRFDDERYEELLVTANPLCGMNDPEEPECVTNLIHRIAETIPTEPFLMSKEHLVRDTIGKLSPDKLGGKFQTLPFYSVKKRKTEYLPAWIFIFLGSNGMAAGNTIEEASIEALSEIMERYSQMQIMDGKIIPPVIPKKYISNIPHIQKVIDEIESSGRFSVRVLDCSLNLKLPVVCGVIKDNETGRVGVKFGAQPNFGVALERIFTEAMQGSMLESFANRSMPDFEMGKANKRMDKWNSVKIASSSVPASLLMSQPSYEFVPWESVNGKANRQIMQDLIDLLQKLGADIYLRDASYLGFPAVNIYAAGISEVKPVDFLEVKMNLLSKRVQGYFRRLNDLTEAEVEDLSNFAASRRGAVIENTVNAISQLFFEDEMPGDGFEADFLYAACQYQLGRTDLTLKTLREIISLLRAANMSPSRYITAIYEYLSGIAAGCSEEESYQVIAYLFPNEANTVRSQFRDSQKVLQNLYPVCDGMPCCEITAGRSAYPQIHEFYKLLVEAENMNPIDPWYSFSFLNECKKGQ